MKRILSLLKDNLFSIDLIDDKQGNNVLQLTLLFVPINIKKWKQNKN